MISFICFSTPFGKMIGPEDKSILPIFQHCMGIPPNVVAVTLKDFETKCFLLVHHGITGYTVKTINNKKSVISK